MHHQEQNVYAATRKNDSSNRRGEIAHSNMSHRFVVQHTDNCNLVRDVDDAIDNHQNLLAGFVSIENGKDGDSEIDDVAHDIADAKVLHCIKTVILSLQGVVIVLSKNMPNWMRHHAMVKPLRAVKTAFLFLRALLLDLAFI